MIACTRNLCLRLPLRQSYRFSSTGSYQAMKDALSKNLYSIDLVNKFLSRNILAMSYSPGVAAVCEAIETDPIEAETLTLRARSIAVITDGSFLNASPEGVAPAMDWIIAQIKHYSGLDAFPFIIDKETDIEDALKDFSTSYGTVLDLDNRDLPFVPYEILFLRHQDVIDITKTEVTDCEKTANVLSYLISKKKKGVAKKDHIKSGLDHQG
jgi:malic enzyme